MSDPLAGLVLRPAARGDAAAIGRVYVETWRTTYAGVLPDKVLIGMSAERQAQSWSRQIVARELVRVAAASSAGVVGFGSAGPVRGGDAGQGEIYTLYVLPDFQGVGIGRRLLAELFEGLRAGGYSSALLWVLAANPSRFFYEAVGGQRSAERVERLWGTDLPEIGYVWPDLDAAVAPDGPFSHHDSPPCSPKGD